MNHCQWTTQFTRLEMNWTCFLVQVSFYTYLVFTEKKFIDHTVSRYVKILDAHRKNGSLDVLGPEHTPFWYVRVLVFNFRVFTSLFIQGSFVDLNLCVVNGKGPRK
jgi:hypothetical protein